MRAEAAGRTPAGLSVAAMVLRRPPLLPGDFLHQRPELLLTPRIIGDSEVALGVADEAVRRADTVVLLDEQAVGEELEDVP